MSFDAEVLIVGGGLAGAAAACLLARAGRRVLLIEREAGPHDKICGEFLSGEAVAYLSRLGLDLVALGAQPIDRMRLVRGLRVVESALPFSAVGLSRRTLDAALIARAEACGARVLRGHRVRLGDVGEDGEWPVTPAPDGAFCLHVDGIGDLQAPALFLATGKHELRGLRRRVGAVPPLVGFKMYFALAPEQSHALAGTVEVLMFDHGYAGLQRVDGGRANLCWLSDRTQLQRCGNDWEPLLDSMLAGSAHLRERLAGAQRLLDRPLAISQVPYGFVHRAAAGDPAQLYRLGDQAAVIPSFAGGGMEIALHSAWLAADAYLSGAGAGHYHRWLAADVAGPIRRAGALYRCGRSALGQSALMRLVQAWPQSMQWAASWTRVASSVTASTRRGLATIRPGEPQSD